MSSQLISSNSDFFANLEQVRKDDYIDLRKDDYIDLLVDATVLLSTSFPPEVQQHGTKMLKHILQFRCEELRSVYLLCLTLILEKLVAPPSKQDTLSKATNPKEQNKYRNDLLKLATNNNLRSLAAEATVLIGNDDEDVVDASVVSKLMPSTEMLFRNLGQRPSALEVERVDFSVVLDPYFSSSSASLAAVMPLALSCPEDPPDLSPRKHQRNIVSQDPHLHSLPFPLDGPVPLSYFGLGTKPGFMSPQKRLICSPESDEIRSSSSSSKSGTRSTNSSGYSTKSSTSSNAPCMSSSGLSFDTQAALDETELEAQRLMSIDIFDNDNIDGGVHDQHRIADRFIVSKTFADIIPPRMLGSDGMVHCDVMKGCVLLAEHKILCEAFIAVTSCGVCIEQDKKVLPYLLNALSNIWTQPQWKSTFRCDAYGLTCLFFHGNFLEMVSSVVKFFENELKKGSEEKYVKMQSYDPCMVSLLRLILPLLLQWLQCVHALWVPHIAPNLPEELESAKSFMINEEGFQQNEKKKLLEEIRESGYNIIGLCMILEGAFLEFLDISSFSYTFLDYLGSMEFRHLGKLIHLVFLPLVKFCPHEVRKDWMLSVLGPLLIHCEEVLYYTWFNHMHKVAQVPYYCGKVIGSAENIKKSVQTLLIEFTREVSNLLGVLSSLESNGGILHNLLGVLSSPESNSGTLQNEKMTTPEDLISISSHSLIGYLLNHDCFGMLRMSLVGYWVDGEAATKAMPFFRALVRLAGVTNDQRIRIFVLDELLPSLLRRLDDQLPCAIRDVLCKLNSSSSTSDNVSKDLILLCREVYNYLSSCFCTQSQGLVGEDQDFADNFTCWLENQKNDLRAKSSRAPPKEFEGGQEKWNWEFEDEFQRYLPVYIDMLNEVDSMDDIFEFGILASTDLIQKLKPEFRAKYAINSSEHHHLAVISRMRRRKYYSMADIKRYKQIYDILDSLITIKPYIKVSDGAYDIIERLEENLELPSNFDPDNVEEAVHVLYSILQVWEPQFHPLIREGHKELLLFVAGELTKAKQFEDFQPLLPNLGDFPTHLIPYAELYIETMMKNSLYDKAVAQIHLHKEYDDYLASGELDSYIYKLMSRKDDISVEGGDTRVVPSHLSALDHDLIKLSLKRRAEIVHMRHQFSTYLECLEFLLKNKLLKDQFTSSMNWLKAEGFFNIDSERTNWSCFQENKHFLELVKNFNDEVFKGYSLPKYYVIRGIIDFQTILLHKHRIWEAFEEVVCKPRDNLSTHLSQFWRDTHHYKHDFYDVIREPLKKIFV